jgi:hypothetical protein
MDGVEFATMLAAELQCVRLVELKRVVRLRFDVHAHNLEPGPVVAHPSPASTTE